jgi:D-alanyl-D-alanine carboxypeptidase
MRHRWGSLALAVSGVLGALLATPAAAGPPPGAPRLSPFAAFDAAVEHATLGGNVSASVAVARNGRTVHAAAFGTADPSTGAAATAATRYRIASISKTFAAMAVWHLVAEGRLDLDAPVLGLLADRLAGLSVRDARVRAITVRELLDQSSGLPTAWGLYFADDAAESCPQAAARALSGRLAAAPGRSYRYSNTNYCILGLVLVAAAGEPFDTYVARTVLAPAGVADAHIARSPDDYQPGDAWHPAPSDSASLGALGAAGEWVATPSDLVRVFDALARPACDSLYPPPAELTARPGPWVKATDSEWYGLGVMVWDGGARWGHSGTIEGGRAVVEHDGDGTTWAITVSGTKPRLGEDLRGLLRVALAQLPGASPQSGVACPVAATG